MARKGKLTISPHIQKDLDRMEEGSPEWKAFRAYGEASARHESLLKRFDDKKWADKDGRVPEKHRTDFNKLCREVDKARSAMFRMFDNARHAASHTIHVPEAEVGTVIYDALMANQEAMPDEYLRLSGPERGREMKRVAADLISLLKGDKVQVIEEDMNAPFCADCQESLS